MPVLKKWLLFIIVLILPLSLFGCNNNGTIPKISSSEVPPVSSQPGWTLFPSGNQVNTMITQGNYLWAATYGGVVRWNLNDGSYRIFTVQDGLPDNRVDAIDQDSRGNIWAATGFQISSYDGVK